MKKSGVLALCLWHSVVHGEVAMNVSTCANPFDALTIDYRNNTPDPWDMRGFGMSIGTGNVRGQFAQQGGGGWFIPPNQSPAVNFAGCSGQIGVPFNRQLEAKIGACNEPSPPQEPEAMQCAAINTIGPFYNPAICLQDALGVNRGDGYGGFIDSYAGQSQIQVALPSGTYAMGGQTVRFDPAGSMGGGQFYMMAMAALQEYLYVDMQFLMAMGASTSGAGLVDATGTTLYRSPANTGIDTNPYGSFTVTYQTAVGRLMKDYPKYFAGIPNMNRLVSTGGTGPTAANSPQQLNSAFLASMNLWWLFDGLKAAQNLCFRQFLEEATDKAAGLKLMLGGYHIGPNQIDAGTGATNYATHVLPTTDPAILGAADITSRMKRFPWDVGGPDHNTHNYITRVFSTLNRLVTANTQSAACGGTLPIYDAGITLVQVRELFFGQGGTVTTQGQGGLLWHFSINAASRQSLWNDLGCAFNALQGKAPGRTASEISYRYDFLTLLRVARQHLGGFVNKHNDRPTPSDTYSSDYSIWVHNHSQIPCTRTTQDVEWPKMTFADTAFRKGEQLRGTFSDNKGIKEFAYTLDTQWRQWSPTTPNFIIPQTLPDNQRLWFRVTDSCGNATIQEVKVINEPPPPQIPTPTANPNGGEFGRSVQVTLAVATDGATLFYTTDGSLPGTSEGGATKRYTGPVTLAESTTLKAIASKPNWRNSEYLTATFTQVVVPANIDRAWYLDEDGDGRIEKAVIVFAENIGVIPDSLAFKIVDAAGQTHDRSVLKRGGGITFASGTQSRLGVAFADPFPYGVTSVSNRETSGQSFRQDDVPIGNGYFPVDDSVAPVILTAEIKETDGPPASKLVEVTYSEPVLIASGPQAPLVFKQEGVELPPVEVRLSSVAPGGERQYIFFYDATSGYVPIVGDSVAINTNGETRDNSSRAPSIKKFQNLEGVIPPARPVTLFVTFPNGSRDNAISSGNPGSMPSLFIPIGSDGTPLPGNLNGKCGQCDPGREPTWVGPVVHTTIPMAGEYEFSVFSNLGAFLSKVSGKVEESDLAFLERSVEPGNPYIIRFVWTGKDDRGTLAGTGAYILKATFRFGRDPKTGAPPSVQTKRILFGVIRSIGN